MTPLLSLGHQPVFMGTTLSDETQDEFHEMEWGATKTGIVHLSTRVSLDVLYSQSHNSGVIGNVWELHHRTLSKFISKYAPNKVCEIGGGHGVLSKFCSEEFQFHEWQIYEPNAGEVDDPRINVVRQMFTGESQSEHMDCFVHSHLFEHLYDHNEILTNIRSSLTDDGLMIFSVPNMSKMLRKGYLNTLNFEHVTYLPEHLVDHILTINKFEVIEKEYYLEDHSIFYACRVSQGISQQSYNHPLDIVDVRSYFSNLLSDVESINNKLLKLESDAKVYLFGAHIFSQFLICNGLKKDLIFGILDNDKNKQERRLYGTPFFVNDPMILRDNPRNVVVLRAGAYNSEIEKQLVEIDPKIIII